MSVSVDVPAARLEAGPRAPRRGRPPPDVPRGGGRAAPRRAAQRPAPGPGRPAPPGRRGVRRDDLRGGVAVPPAVRRDDARRSRELTPGRLRAAYERGARSGAGHAHRRRRPAPASTSRAHRRAAARRLGAGASGRRTTGRIVDAGAVRERFVRVVHRPGAVQTEIRIGHVGVPRRIDDFHALSVMGAILGGLFNSRLNMKLREEKGYTYGAGAGFDLRRAAGPFARPGRGQHRGDRPGGRRLRSPSSTGSATRPVTPAELTAARDFLVGVFPLRFETPGPDRRGAVGAGRPRAARRRAGPLPAGDRGGRRRRRPARPRRAGSTRTRRRSSSSATPTRSARTLEAAGFGPVDVERDEGPGRGGPRAPRPPRPSARSTRVRRARRRAPRSRRSRVRTTPPRRITSDGTDDGR